MDTQLIEQRALEVLAHCPRGIWNPQQPPVPVDEIAYDCYDLDVREVEPEVMASAPGAPELGPGQSLSGLLIPSRGQIWVNAEEARQWPGRRRFTICHELGHHILHQTGQQSLFCRHATVKRGGDRRGARTAAAGRAGGKPLRGLAADARRPHQALLRGDRPRLRRALPDLRNVGWGDGTAAAAGDLTQAAAGRR